MLIMYSQKLYRASTVSVSLASTSLLVPAQNALRIVRKYVLEFFQPLAAPPTYQKPRPTDKTELSYGHRAVSRAETRKQQNCTYAETASLANRLGPRRLRNTKNELHRR